MIKSLNLETQPSKWHKRHELFFIFNINGSFVKINNDLNLIESQIII